MKFEQLYLDYLSKLATDIKMNPHGVNHKVTFSLKELKDLFQMAKFESLQEEDVLNDGFEKWQFVIDKDRYEEKKESIYAYTRVSKALRENTVYDVYVSIIENILLTRIADLYWHNEVRELDGYRFHDDSVAKKQLPFQKDQWLESKRFERTQIFIERAYERIALFHDYGKRDTILHAKILFEMIGKALNEQNSAKSAEQAGATDKDKDQASAAYYPILKQYLAKFGTGGYTALWNEDDLFDTIINENARFQMMGKSVRKSLHDTFHHMVEQGEFSSIEELGVRGEIIKLINIVYFPKYEEMEGVIGLRAPMEKRKYMIVRSEEVYRLFKENFNDYKNKQRDGIGLGLKEWDFWFFLREQFNQAKRIRPRGQYDKAQYKAYIMKIFNLYEKGELREMESALNRIFPAWFADFQDA